MYEFFLLGQKILGQKNNFHLKSFLLFSYDTKYPMTMEKGISHKEEKLKILKGLLLRIMPIYNILDFLYLVIPLINRIDIFLYSLAYNKEGIK